MKITDPEVIKAGEKDLIDSVKEDLDWDVVKEIVKKQLKVTSFESEGGEIVVHNNQIAFKLDLALKLNVSLMFDRNGSYIPEQDETEDQAEAGLDVKEEAGEVDLKSDEDLDPGDMEIEDDDTTSIDSDVDEPEAEVIELSENEQILDLEQVVLPDDGTEEEEEDLDGISLPDDDTSEEKEEEDDLDGISLSDDDTSEEKVLDLEAISLSDEEGDDSELDLDEISLVDEGTDESLDDDIDDILKESREFWEQKKDNE